MGIVEVRKVGGSVRSGSIPRVSKDEGVTINTKDEFTPSRIPHGGIFDLAKKVFSFKKSGDTRKVTFKSVVIDSHYTKASDGTMYALGCEKNDRSSMERRVCVIDPSTGKIEGSPEKFYKPTLLGYYKGKIYVLAQKRDFPLFKGVQKLFCLDSKTLEVENEWDCQGEYVAMDEKSGIVVSAEPFDKNSLYYHIGITAYDVNKDFSVKWKQTYPYGAYIRDDYLDMANVDSICFSDDSVMVSCEIGLACYDAKAGLMRWKYTIPKDSSGIRSDLKVDKDKVYFKIMESPTSSYLIGLDVKTGNEVSRKEVYD